MQKKKKKGKSQPITFIWMTNTNTCKKERMNKLNGIINKTAIIEDVGNLGRSHRWVVGGVSFMQ